MDEHGASRSRAAMAPGEAGPATSMAAIVVAGAPALVEICGLRLLERALRALAQAGVTDATVVSAQADVLALAGRPHWSRKSLAVRTALRAAAAESPSLTVAELAALSGGQAVLYVPGDVLCDVRLIEALRAGPGSVALVDSQPPPGLRALLARAPRTSRGLLCGPGRLEPAFLAAEPGAASVEEALPRAVEEGRVQVLDVAGVPGYLPQMRRTLRPLWFPAPARGDVRTAEAVVLDSAQKGVLDLPAIVHGPIETAIVRWLCRTRITPNQMTLAAAAAAWGATGLFASGRLGAGLAVALAVGVLDGLDGKQARVKLETSRTGELEHVSDFLFELSWWAALAWHFHATGALPWAPLVVLALYFAEGVDGLVKLAAMRRLGRMIDDAAPFLRLVRLVGGRRNVYVWIMAGGYLAGNAAGAFFLLPFWEGATAALHLAWGVSNLRVGRSASAPQPAGGT